jgi:hypothetical protein
MTRRAQLIVVASAVDGTAERIAARLREDGAVAYATHSLKGCLRVATSLRPDIVVIDPALPGRLEQLLRAHPMSAHARFLYLTDDAAAPIGVERTAHLVAA